MKARASWIRVSAVVLGVSLVASCREAQQPIPQANTAPEAGTHVLLDGGTVEAQGSHSSAVELLKLLRASTKTGKSAEPEEVRRMVAELHAKASRSEGQILDRVLALLDEMAGVATILDGDGTFEEKQRRTRPALDRILRGYVQAARELAALEPDDDNIQASLVSTLYYMPDLARSLSAQEPERDGTWHREGVAKADALVQRFPLLARTHEFRGWICVNEHEDRLACLRHYAACMKLEGAAAGCAKTYRVLAEDTVAPRCSAAGLRPELKLFTATYFSGPGTRSILSPMKGPSGKHEKMHIDLHSGFDMKDLVDVARAGTVQVETRTWDAAARALGPIASRTSQVVFWNVKKERQAQFDAWIAKTVDRHISTWLVILEGKRWVAAGEFIGDDDHAPLRLDDVSIDEICTKTVRPSLPADLPPPQ
jgi:hypothetical protein